MSEPEWTSGDTCRGIVFPKEDKESLLAVGAADGLSRRLLRGSHVLGLCTLLTSAMPALHLTGSSCLDLTAVLLTEEQD